MCLETLESILLIMGIDMLNNIAQAVSFIGILILLLFMTSTF